MGENGDPDVSGASGASGASVIPDMSDEEYLCTRIKRAEQALMAHHEAVLRGYGLTMTQYTVLLAVSRAGGMSGAQLARAAGVTQQTMATVLNGLEGKQLITRQPSPVHAKVMITDLTPSGQEVLNRAFQEVNALERAFADTFTPAEHAALSSLLDHATSILIAQTPRPGSAGRR